MARTSNITFGQVAAIADAMKAAGNRPTARAVRERIGSGSMGTIHKLLQQWTGKGAADDEETETAELPTHIAKALMDFIGTEIATACEPINEELQQAKETAEQIAEENIRLEGVIDRLQRERDEIQNNYASLKGSIAEIRKEADEAKIQWKNLQASNTELLRDLDRAQRQLEIVTNLQPDLVKAQTALAESERFRINAEKEVAVVHAQLAAEVEKTKELRQRAGDAEAKANARETELKQANNHYQACAARLEAAAREIESLRKTKATPQPKAKPATAKKTTTKPTA
ncbi:MAG: mucin-associated surface protein [Proteobacteria bacterium]|nr:mucin-associated surface protein [Pseudomonadota bacterium]